MRVRYLSGRAAGEIVEMGEEAAILLSNHIVARVGPDDPDPIGVAPIVDPDPAAGASLTDEDTNDSTTETPEPEPVPARVRRRATRTPADPSTTRRKRR
jgi:hypothetical protein